MNSQDRQLFEKLKAKVLEAYFSNTGIKSSMEDWTQGDIRHFQDDLEDKVQSKVSEKWVYTHFKHEGDRLPRVDVLDLLSRYAGYNSWSAFTSEHEVKAEEADRARTEGPDDAPRAARGGNYGWVGVLIAAIFLTMFWLNKNMDSNRPLYIHLTDSYTGNPIVAPAGSLTASPGSVDSAGVGYYKIDLKDSTLISFDDSYYQPVMVTVSKSGKDTTEIKVKPDDKAFMLNYFSNASSDQWLQKAAQLDSLIDPAARIYHYYPEFDGVELLNKDEFILKLTAPTKILKNMKIQDIQYQDDKIYRLRYTVEDL